MRKRLRNLAGLVDFETAARCGGFQQAAAELHKTPAAVSQQIRQLEQTLGFTLFSRHAQCVHLTERGRLLASTVSEVLRTLHDKIDHLQDEDPEATLRITSTHSFSLKWLAPRLARFTNQVPGCDLRLESSDTALAVGPGACDVAIRYVQMPGQAGLATYPEQLIVAYSPLLASHIDIDMLLRFPLLYEGTTDLWQQIIAELGLNASKPDFAHRFSHSGLLVQAAVAGHGIALLPYSLASHDLESGQLIRIALPARAHTHGYQIHASTPLQPKVSRFVQWFDQEMTALQDLLDT
ncbi:LysR substrate-binding domain-containing protein [Leeia aquatica]|uniref:LysR family transcriptional regulator n=1 Tax=Leeia aquatica TaxID=2725557 RepID=A0A847S7S9_9NEIS|nr:LysR substrate-binding domain-containing protein [Leeia aquatica]NLR76004.1 LysR family transcriptional regulator [Leeia aquatica]